MLELKNITKVYEAGTTQVEALKGINIAFRENEFVAILGQSGCGKTTLLNIIGGLDRYTSGDLIINGRSTKEYDDRDWDTYRNHSIGFVFQSFNLLPRLTVIENVMLPLSYTNVPRSQREMRAVHALQAVTLPVDHWDHRISELSGGQMQRVAIARALVNDPPIILADEPTGNLDPARSLEIMMLLEQINALGTTVLVVTHERELVNRFTKRVVAINEGRIISDGMDGYYLNEEE